MYIIKLIRCLKILNDSSSYMKNIFLSTSIILAAFNEAFTLHCHFISESTKVYVKEYFNSFKKTVNSKLCD